MKLVIDTIMDFFTMKLVTTPSNISLLRIDKKSVLYDARARRYHSHRRSWINREKVPS